MAIAARSGPAPWLLLAFTLPAKRASQRVEVWRRLQRCGAVLFSNSGYLLPNTPANQEHFEWLAAMIRKHGGEAFVIKIRSIDRISSVQLIRRFSAARARDYRALMQEIRRLPASPGEGRGAGRWNHLRAKLREITAIDFFGSPQRKQAEELLARAGRAGTSPEEPLRVDARGYSGRIWVTRPRPGIDRSASAWLIRNFIDLKARFAFATEPGGAGRAVPFDMFTGDGFGHRGDDCTFETLQKSFHIRDPKVAVIGEMIHDADLQDEKFGRKEGFGLDAVLRGWARRGFRDPELLRRGMELMAGLYDSLGSTRGGSI